VVEPPAFARGLFPACLKMKMKMEGMQQADRQPASHCRPPPPFLSSDQQNKLAS